MTYSIAFNSTSIELRTNCSEDEIISILMEYTDIPDLYEGMSIQEACDMIDDCAAEGYFIDGFAFTIVDYNDNVIYSIGSYLK